MAINPEVQAFLETKQIDYEIINHERVLSTIDEARALGIAADEVGKCLVVHATHTPGDLALVIVPGSAKISNRKLRQVFATKHARLALEPELGEAFPQFELGAVPPFGQLFGFPTYVDRLLVNHASVLFNGGSHTESIKMSMHDFLNIADAALIDVVADEEMAA